MEIKKGHLESAVGAIIAGAEAPIHNMPGWLSLRDDLDNSQDAGLEGLRDYVKDIIDTNITRPWMDHIAEQMRNHDENLPENQSRDNSQYSDSI